MKNPTNPATNRAADTVTSEVIAQTRDIPVSLIRRLAAIAYDSVAVLALLFFCTLPIVIAQKGQAVAAENPYYFGYLLICAFFYFGISWTRGGQTLGMRAWKIKVVRNSEQDTALGTADALKRYLFAGISWLCAGLGFLWALFDKNRQTWHDKWSNTHLIHSAPNI